jgi:hypothetical protein
MLREGVFQNVPPHEHKSGCDSCDRVVIAHIYAAAYPQDEIVVPEGTPSTSPSLRKSQVKKLKPNDPVDFTVYDDLVINGQVIVRKGTPADRQRYQC